MVNIVFCISEGKYIGIGDEFDSKTATYLIKYRESVMLLDRFLSNVIRHNDDPISIRLLICYKGETHLIDIHKISHIEITKRMVEVHVTEGGETVYKAYAPMKQLESALVRLGFIRVNRYTLVSIAHIRKICGTRILLGNNSLVTVGRSYFKELSDRVLSEPNIVVKRER